MENTADKTIITVVGKDTVGKMCIRDRMHGAADLAVTLEIDAHVGKNWYEAK